MIGMGWQMAEQSVSDTEYNDNWIRAFRKDNIPKLQKEVIAMLNDWKDENELRRIVLYLQKYERMDDEMTEFMLREIIRGNI